MKTIHIILFALLLISCSQEVKEQTKQQKLETLRAKFKIDKDEYFKIATEQATDRFSDKTDERRVFKAGVALDKLQDSIHDLEYRIKYNLK